MLSRILMQALLFHGLLVYAQSLSQLGYIPLAVKTPYLHAWFPNSGTPPTNVWPKFFDTGRILGWAGYIRVDGRPYQWMGDSGDPSINYTRTVTSDITPTKSIFRLEAGLIQFNVTYLSPIEPMDYVRQSIPFTYTYIDGLSANDSQPHTVQVYSDISGEWVSSIGGTEIVWNTTTENNVIYHQVTRQVKQPFVENNGVAEDSTVYYAMSARPNLTWQTGADGDCRGRFTSNGTLANSTDTNFRAITKSFPVFAIAVDLGIIRPNDQPQPVVWALGVVRDPLVTYTSESNVQQNRSAYYWSAYSSIEKVISSFLDDFAGALSRSQALDSRILSDAAAISSNYAAILSLVTRQFFASIDITIPSAQPGQFNNTDVKLFMKDIGSSSRVNPVEFIYSALPALLYFNATMARDLLQPLLELQSSSRYPNKFAAPDVGTTYPVILGDSPNNSSFAVEDTGNMLIMVYAHAVKSGDGSLLNRYFPLFQRWGDFLVGNVLHPNSSTTADGLSLPDMSNLALKGILGVYAMGKISEAVKAPQNVTAFYTDRAQSLIGQWRELAVTQGHITSVYGQVSSWGLIYNLFPAVWLQTGLIGDDLLNSQAQFYRSQSATTFGFNLDSFIPQATFPHWMLLTAATIPGNSPSIRDVFISLVYNRAYLSNHSPLPARYSTSDGGAFIGSGTPAHGAAYAILALSLQNQNINTDAIQAQLGLSGSGPGVGAIVGGVIGGVVVLVVLAGITVLFYRRRKVRREKLIDAQYSRPTPFIDSTDGLANSRNTPINNGIAGDGLHKTAATALAKHREVLGASATQTSTDQPTTGVYAASTPSTAQSTSNIGTNDLRVEMEQLRTELNTIRAMADLPPGYT